MNRYLPYLVLVAALAAVLVVPGQQAAFAQIPPGVTVDSIAPANDFTNEFPMRAHNIVANPATGQIAFVSGTAGAGANPAWLSSTDNGLTWSSLTGFLPAGDARVAFAADSAFTVHIAYRHAFPDGNIGIMYNKDPFGDGTGLALNGTLVNDTSTVHTPNYPDIAVSPDGQNIIITAIHWNRMDSLYAFVSHNGGTTWEKHTIINVYDPAVAPKPPHNPTSWRELQWYCTSVAMGTNGYAFAICSSNYDSLGIGSQLWEIVTETTDYGTTWTPAAWVTPPAPTDFLPGTGFGQTGTVVVTNGNIPHFADRMVFPSGQQAELVEFHKESGNWVYHAISHWDPSTTSYDNGRLGSMGVGQDGNLYCLYCDQNKSQVPPGRVFGNFETWQVFLSGSSDNGNTWTQPVRLTGQEPILVQSDTIHTAYMTRFPTLVPSTATGIVFNGVSPGYYGAGTGVPLITAWVQIRFPLSVAWSGPYDHDPRAPKPGGYSITGNGGSVYNWYEISGTGTKATNWFNWTTGDTARDDGTAGPLPLGFNFSYYGQNYSQVMVGANGLLGFNDPVLNSALAGTDPLHTVGFFDASYVFPGPVNPFHSVVALYYNDLDLRSHAIDGFGHGDVYYWTNAASDTAVIEWWQVGNFNSSTDTTITFEAILAKADSSVTVLYKDVGVSGTALSAKVGVQANDSTGVFYTVGGYPTANTPANGTGVTFKVTGTLGVKPGPHGLPMTFALYQNYPNPFNPVTKILYSLARASNVSLTVYNILGQKVATLAEGRQAAGSYQVNWDARNYGSGMYFYQLTADGNVIGVKKMLLLK